MQSETEKAFWRDQPEMHALRELSNTINDAWGASVTVYQNIKQVHAERANLLIPTNTLLYYAKVEVDRIKDELDAIQHNRHQVLLKEDAAKMEQL